MTYRVSARGLLLKDDEILFVEYVSSKGSIYALPGGGQQTGKSLKETLKREFKEETNLDIEPREVIIVREFMLDTSEFEQWKNGIHQVEIIFRCFQSDPGAIASAGSKMDVSMKGIKWIHLDDICKYTVYPRPDLKTILEKGNITYLFDKG